MSPPIDANRLLAVVAEVAREARPHFEAYVALDSSLERELGLDSLARVELVLRLEREFAASLPEQALASSETPRDLLRFLLASAGQAPKAADRTLASLVQAEGVRPPMPRERSPRRSNITPSASRAADGPSLRGSDEKSLTYRALWDGALLYAARLARPASRRGGPSRSCCRRARIPVLLLRRAARRRHPGAALSAGAPGDDRDHMTRHIAS